MLHLRYPKTPYAYLGLLGERKGRIEIETETAIKFLEKEGFTFERVMIVIIKECENDWEDVAPIGVEWYLVNDEEIKRVEGVESRVEAKLPDLVRNYVLIMDCTAATFPTTIAYYKLADRHKVPLIYVYWDTKELASR
nr:hypothetical protein [Candidatus Freyarchaeota archaeon]